MARPASPTATEGYGFTYADKIGALALLALLMRAPLAEQSLGYVTRVRFGQRPAGWHFDDVVLTLEGAQGESSLALSIKSDNHFSSTSIDREVVDLVWQQAEDTGPFREGVDVLGLVQPSASPTIKEELAELYRWSTRQGEGQLATWLQLHVGTNTKRSYVQSVEIGGAEKDGQRFFRMFRALFLDMDEPYDQTTRAAVADCLAVLQYATEANAEALWTHLCQIASEARGSAAAFSLADIVQRITPYFALREHPRVEQDIKKLRDFSEQRHQASVKDVIGDDLHLPTDQGEAQLVDALARSPIVLFLGESGTGKSVVLKDFVKAQGDGELRLYLRADLGPISPSELQHKLSLSNDLATCLLEGRFKSVVLVIDQVDRLLRDEQVADLIEFIQTTRNLQPTVKIILGCQTAETERVISRLSVIIKSNDIERAIFAPEEEALFERVIDRFPSLKNLAFRSELRPVFLRAKNLDLLVGRLDQLGQLSSQEVTSQKQFIDWFWDKYVSDGPHGVAQATLMRELATAQAQTLNPVLDPASVADRASLDKLRQAGLVAGDDKGITFQHDLYGDWARLRIIESNRSNLASFLTTHAKNPLWLRAFRLWSAVLLETEGAQAWKAVFDSLTGEGAAQLLCKDALLDGLGFAAGSYAYLNALKEDLFANNGELLNRFLARFLFASSSPDYRYSDLLTPSSLNLTTLKANLRIPRWYLWAPVVQFVVSNAQVCRLNAPGQAIQVILPWLENVPKDWPLLAECADLALDIASDYLAESRRFGSRKKGDEFLVFRCMFRSLRYHPERAVALIREAIGRTGEDPYPETEFRGGKRYRAFRSSGIPHSEEVVGPWPNGPISDVDDRFREFVLLGGGLGELLAYDRELAREIILAAIIREPHTARDHWMFDPDHDLGIVEDHEFYPPLYNKGLFKHLFQHDPELAIEVVLAITEFTVERAKELISDPEKSQDLQLEIRGERRDVSRIGYGWHRDDTKAPDIVASALMALEQYLYGRLETDLEDPSLDTIITQANSLATIGLLVTVGKRFPYLFQRKLRFLHWNDFIQGIDISQAVQGEHHQMVSWAMRSDAETREAQEWHERPYRKHLLKNCSIFALNSVEGRDEAKVACEKWAQLRENATEYERGRLDNLVAVYGIENYSFTQQGDQVLIQCNLPESLQKEATVFQEASEKKVRPIFLSFEARQVLDGQKTIDNDAAVHMLAQATELTEPEDDNAILGNKDAQCGVAAMLLLKFPHLVESNVDMADWCRETLVGVCLDPPAVGELDSPHSTMTNLWFHFAAQAIPALWGKASEDPKLRAAIAALITHGHYNTTGYLGISLFKLYQDKPDLYFQALSLLRYWSIETIRLMEVERKRGFEEYAVLDVVWPNFEQAKQAFLDGSLPVSLAVLPQPIPQAPEGRRNFNHERDRARHALDTERLFRFACNLPASWPPEAKGQRDEVIQRLSEVVEYVITEIENGGDDSAGRAHAYHFELNLFEVFGKLIASLPDKDFQQKWIARIAELTRIARDHVKQFLYGFIARTLQMTNDAPAHADQNFLLMVEVYLGTQTPTKDSWTQKHGSDKWEDWVLGNDHILRRYHWQAQHALFIERHKGIIESWCRAMTRSGRALSGCLDFLHMPACEGIAAEACQWIDEELQGQVPRGDDDLVENLASFLSMARPLVSRARQSHPEIFDSFLNLAAMLNIRNNRLAMQLFEDVATSP